ncbi:F-box domain-containing protein [Mycena chlorophos]|uniref:F-box domain-containing protein n=1 Tax=Mycena chlorophos TaxID=658473 RepID=A0A8H6VP27_MYCCL|nr:F-box domain-containing protein [Mycena chlorophos]
MPLTQLPTDLVLAIIQHLELADAARLLSTCRALQPLAQLKNIYLQTLRNHPGPTPCPPGTPLTDLSLAALRQYAIRAYTLARNWSSARPTPHSMHSIPFLEPGQSLEHIQLNVIPGTPLLVVCDRRTLSCRETQTGRVLARLRLVPEDDVGRGYRMGRTPGLNLRGRSLFALAEVLPASQEHIGQCARVVELTYDEDYGAVQLKLTHDLRTGVLPQELLPASVPDAALSETHVCLAYHRRGTRLPVLIHWRLDDAEGRATVVPLQERMGAAPSVIVQDGAFYVAGIDSDKVIRVSETGKVDYIAPKPSDSPSTKSGRASNPATFLLGDGTEGAMRISLTPTQDLVFSALPTHPGVGSTPTYTSPLAYTAPKAHPGTRITRLWPGVSGRAAVILACAPRQTGLMGALGWRVELVRYHPWPARIKARALPLRTHFVPRCGAFPTAE